MAPRLKLEVQVEMCCQGCVDNVEEVLNETHGISDYKIERYNSLVIITGNPHGGPDRKELVKRLKKATHGKRAEILRKTEIQTPAAPRPAGVYVGYPSTAPGFQPVPWPSPPVITPVISNPFYFQRPVRCHYCAEYSDIVCTNCGRGSNF